MERRPHGNNSTPKGERPTGDLPRRSGADATGQQVGEHVFRDGDDLEYVGKGDARGDWEPNEELINDDAPQSALDAAEEAADADRPQLILPRRA